MSFLQHSMTYSQHIYDTISCHIYNTKTCNIHNIMSCRIHNIHHFRFITSYLRHHNKTEVTSFVFIYNVHLRSQDLDEQLYEHCTDNRHWPFGLLSRIILTIFHFLGNKPVLVCSPQQDMFCITLSFVGCNRGLCTCVHF